MWNSRFSSSAYKRSYSNTTTLLHLWPGLILPLLLIVLSGCANPGSGPGSSGSGSGSGNSTYPSFTGNWEIQVTPKNGPTPFTALAGFIYESGQGTSEFLTASLQAQPSTCYTDAVIIPLYGGTDKSGLNLTSFSVNGQVLSINVQADTAGTQFSGNYSIKGGCADGASGTLTGTEYAAVDGTYAGTITGSSPAETMSLDLSQYIQGTGSGAFLVTGSATFTGISCFSQGTLASTNGTVIGNAVNLTFNTNDPEAAQLTVAGTIDTAAKTLTLTSIQVVGGSCPGSLGTATLTLQ